MRKNLSFVGLSTFGGILVAGIIWLIVYSLRVRGATGFDGPAGVALGASMILGGLICGLTAITIYSHKNKEPNIMAAIVIWLFIGFISCMIVGLGVSTYAQVKFPDGKVYRL